MKTRSLFLAPVVLIAAYVTGTALLPGLLASAWASPDAAKTKAVDAPKSSSQAAGIASLPTAAQSAISAAIGRDQSDYQAKPTIIGDFGMANPEGRLNVEFAKNGVAVRVGDPKGAGWDFKLKGYGRGNSMNLVASAVPQANANRVEYHHGGITEWYVNGPLGLEQGFTLARPPSVAEAHDDQPLTIALALSGGLTASLDPAADGLTLKRPDGQSVLRYAGLSAQDAAGETLKCWLELHGSQLLLRIDDAGARYPIVVDPWVQATELTVSSTLSGGIGRSVAVGGNTIVVGASGTTVGSVAQGAVFVFVEPATGGWAAASVYELTASNGAAGDDFGLSVGIDAGGDTIVVGAPQTGTSSGAGVAYVFVEPAGGWATTSTYKAELVADDVTPFGEFGWSVGIDASGDTVVVGAFATPFDPRLANDEQGEAYVFVEPTVGTTRAWTSGPETETAKLIASDGKAGDSLGISVGINESGDTVVAGAVDATVTAQYQGAAYVFVEPTVSGVPTWVSPTTPPTTPTFSAKLVASDATSDSHLGWSVGISGNTVVAGAYQANIGSNLAQGATYVFVDTGPIASDWVTPTTTPTFNAKLTASDGGADDEFGASVGISGSTVVVGAASTAGGVGTGAAAAYVFTEPTSGGWTNTSTSAELTGGTAGNLFGYSVAVNGNTVVVSAPDATNASGIAQGAAYVFTATEPYAQYSPPQVSFGNVNLNAPATQTVTVTNTGGAPLIIQLVVPSAEGTIFNVTQYMCNGNVSSPPVYPLTISANGSCTFTVQFDPTALGADDVQLGFEDNAGVGQSNVTSTQSGATNFLQSLPLTGTGVNGGTSIAIFSAGTLGLTSALVGSNISPQQLTLQNEGGAAMTVSLITVTTNGAYPNQFFLSNASCANGTVPQTTYPAYAMSGFSIVAGDTCTFTLSATPELVGAITGQIAFVETAASSNICATGSLATCMTGSNGTLAETIPLTGSGTGTPGIAVGAQSESFPNQPLGVKATAPIINVSNTGNVPLYFAAIGIQGPNQADFGETTTCSISSPLPPVGNNVCMITVTFTPSTTAQESATLFITNSAQNTNIPLAGNGAVPTTTTTTISSTSSNLFGYALPAGYALVGNPIAVNFTVQPASGSLIPTGPVNVQDGFSESCNPQGTLTSANGGKGSCALTINSLGTGSTTLSATYTPDAASSSAGLLGSATAQPLFTENLVQIINCGTAPAAQMAPAGTTTVFTFTACLAGGVAGTVSAVCSNLPPMASCNPAPTVTEIGTSGVYTVSISVVTAAGGNIAPLRDQRPSRETWPPTLFGIAMLLVFLMTRHLAGIGKRRMRTRLLYAAGFVIALALLLGNINGCGSSNSPGSTGSTGTPPSAYTIDITIKAGTYSVIVPLTLNVTG